MFQQNHEDARVAIKKLLIYIDEKRQKLRSHHITVDEAVLILEDPSYFLS